MKLSVCIITLNEADKLKRCLESLKKYDVEIVVVDTGSMDDTQKVIDEYADVSESFVWCDNFSKARNYSISKASNDLVLILDSDEWIEKADFDRLIKMYNENKYIAGRIERINTYTTNNQEERGHERICRVFDRRFYCYKGRIHEQVIPKETTDEQYINVPVIIGHSGYEGSVEDKKKKALRNIRLLLMDIDEYGDDPYTLYQLGKSYYMLKDYDKSAEYFERGLGFDLEPSLEYVQDMVETYGYCLLNLKRYDEMMFLKNIYSEFAITADYMFLMGLAYMNNGMFDEAEEEFKKAAECKVCKVEGCNGYKSWYNTGVINECLGKKQKATAYYRKCGNYEPALAGLRRCASE